MLTSDETRDLLADILSDRLRTAKVVLAAIHALDTLDDADDQGLTPDGDEAIVSARNKLGMAIRVEIELEAIVRGDFS